MTNSDFSRVIFLLKDLEEDGVPKSLSSKIADVIQILSSADEPSIRASKALSELEPVVESANVQPHTRMELFNVVSMLEGF